jgi:hypothetical protein
MNTTKSSYDSQSATASIPIHVLRVRLNNVVSATPTSQDGTVTLELAAPPALPETVKLMERLVATVPGLTEAEADELNDEVYSTIMKKTLMSWFRSHVTIVQ